MSFNQQMKSINLVSTTAESFDINITNITRVFIKFGYKNLAPVYRMECKPTAGLTDSKGKIKANTRSAYQRKIVIELGNAGKLFMKSPKQKIVTKSSTEPCSLVLDCRIPRAKPFISETLLSHKDIRLDLLWFLTCAVWLWWSVAYHDLRDQGI